MASNSGLYVTNFVDILDTTQLAVDFTLASSVNVALYDSTGFSNANYSTDQYYSNTNEIATGGGYTQLGVALGSMTLTESPSGTMKWTGATTSWSSSTISGAACAKLFFVNNASGSAFASNARPLVALVWFGVGGPYSTSSGTFTIQWSGTGIFTVDLTP